MIWTQSRYTLALARPSEPDWPLPDTISENRGIIGGMRPCGNVLIAAAAATTECRGQHGERTWHSSDSGKAQG